MVAHSFTRIGVVPAAKAMLEDILRKVNREISPADEEAATQDACEICTKRLQLLVLSFEEKTAVILEEFPAFADLHPFYVNLFLVLYDKDYYTLAVGRVRDTQAQVGMLAGDYLRLLQFADTAERCNGLEKAATERISASILEMGSSLAFIEQVRQHLARLPVIDPNSRTLLLCGCPNVGKSSFMNQVTKANVDVQPYAFTTKSLFVGHANHKYLRWQVIDTPGLLDRRLEDRNVIEMQAITALTHLKAAILFFIDLSESCGYSIKNQVDLFVSLKTFLLPRPVVVVLNKSDLTTLEQCTPDDQALINGLQGPHVVLASCAVDDPGASTKLLGVACDLLLSQRTEDVLQRNAARSSDAQAAVPIPAAQVRSEPVGEIERCASDAAVVEEAVEEAAAQTLAAGARTAEGENVWDLVDPEIEQALDDLQDAENSIARTLLDEAANTQEGPTTLAGGEDGGSAPIEGLLGLPWALVAKCWPAQRVVQGSSVCRSMRGRLVEHASEVWVVRAPASEEVSEWHLAQSFRRLRRLAVSLAWTDGSPATVKLLRALPSAGVGSALRRLQLQSVNLRDNVQDLAALLRSCAQLAWLDLSKSHFDAGAMQQLTGAIGACSGLEHVAMRENRLGAGGVEMLVEALQHCPGLRHLDLQQCRVGAGGMEHLARSVQRWERLSGLQLQTNGINVDAVDSFLRIGECNALQHLGLSHNVLSSDGVLAMAAVVSGCAATLEQLELRGCDIEHEQVGRLADALLGCERLTSLDLGGNCFCEEADGAASLVRVLGSTSLARLDLADTALASGGMAALASGLGAAAGLTHLNLHGIGAGHGDAVLEAMADGVAQCTGLTSLCLGGRTLPGSVAVAAVVRALRGPLVRLDMQGVELEDAQMDAVAEGLRACGRLSTLDLSADLIGDRGAARLAWALEGCSRLTSLNLSDNCIGNQGATVLAGQLGRCCPGLKCLNLQLNPVDDTEAVAEVLQTCSGLDTLTFRRDDVVRGVLPAPWHE